MQNTIVLTQIRRIPHLTLFAFLTLLAVASPGNSTEAEANAIPSGSGVARVTTSPRAIATIQRSKYRIAAFAQADLDGNGYLSLHEFFGALKSKTPVASASPADLFLIEEVRAQTAFGIHDYNADNRLSLAEWGEKLQE